MTRIHASVFLRAIAVFFSDLFETAMTNPGNPQPHPDDRGVFDADAAGYHEYKYGQRQAPLHWYSFESRRRRIVELLPERIERAVDLGTGSGAYLEELASRAGLLVALDFSMAMLREARESNPSCRHFVQADALALPIPDASVDLVNCIGVIEYLPEAPRCLAEIARVLRPGGVALVSVPGAHSLWRMTERVTGPFLRRARRLMGRSREGLGMDSLPRTLYTPGSFRRLAEGAGLEIDRVAWHNYRLPFVGALSPRLTMAMAERMERIRWGGAGQWLSGGMVIRCRRGYEQ
jgi:SAM-dependent methyltransferase